MRFMCSGNRSVFALASCLALFGFLFQKVEAARGPADDQRSAMQKLFEEGSYTELISAVEKERAGGAEGAESMYLAA